MCIATNAALFVVHKITHSHMYYSHMNRLIIYNNTKSTFILPQLVKECRIFRWTDWVDVGTTIINSNNQFDKGHETMVHFANLAIVA